MSHLPAIALFYIDDDPMTYWKAVVFTLAGLVGVVAGVLGKTFYCGDEFSNSKKVAPTWSGRAMFIGIGSIFILWGLHFLLFEQ